MFETLQALFILNINLREITINGSFGMSHMLTLA